MSRTIVITGSGSGLGAAVRARLEAAGDRVIGVDLRGQEIEADLATATGRSAAMNAGLDACEGKPDGLVVSIPEVGLEPAIQRAVRAYLASAFYNRPPNALGATTSLARVSASGVTDTAISIAAPPPSKPGGAGGPPRAAVAKAKT